MENITVVDAVYYPDWNAIFRLTGSVKCNILELKFSMYHDYSTISRE